MSEATILVGDVRQRLSDIADGSVQCCVTSPPYWGLRDYGTGSWDGGDIDCDHQGKPMATKANINRNCGTGNDVKNATAREFYKDVCGKCGATRVDSQIGLEQTPEAYDDEMVGVFREVWRVMADDGVLWLNLGDSYAGSGKGRNADGSANVDPNSKQVTSLGTIIGTLHKSTPDGLKPKDLVGIPWRVAFALQADGWYLRQDIIWAKPNPMPESVTDRCTKSHEYLFMLTKSARYYFDNVAIKEPSVSYAADKRANKGRFVYDVKFDGTPGTGNQAFVTINETRNKRSVWTITTKPFKGAHFAVMPEALVEPCVLASSRPNDLVLDPFTGSGTVAVVALKHGRNFIGTELNPEYAEIAKNRIQTSQPMFNEVNVDFHTPLV
jgi:DNA modification methylase